MCLDLGTAGRREHGGEIEVQRPEQDPQARLIRDDDRGMQVRRCALVVALPSTASAYPRCAPIHMVG